MPTIGGVRIDASHSLAWHRGITWCWRCGAIAMDVPYYLRNSCKPPTVRGARQLARLRQGMTPCNSVQWVLPECNSMGETGESWLEHQEAISAPI